MPDLSIKNLPEQLYRRLKQSAKRNRRSLNKEAAYRIELGLESRPERSPAEIRDLIKGARRLRSVTKTSSLTDREIRAEKQQGRP